MKPAIVSTFHCNRSVRAAAAILVMGCLSLGGTLGLAITWDGGGADNKFSTSGNWDPDTVVTALAGANVIFDTLVSGGQDTADVNVAENFSTLVFNSGAAVMSLTTSGNSIGPVSIPEPATALLGALGLVVLLPPHR